MTNKLGRLKEVDIRDLWKHEQYDFSNWLAKEENIELLNEQLGLTLTNIQQEVYVGQYRCDLVAEDETSNIKVIIENQLEATNHDHLGKTIVYASGLNAEVIVWIVREAREEHRSAIEWLNNNTSKNISFFLMEIHAYKIGDSLPAPYFKMIEKPNDFVKNAKDSNGDSTLSKTNSEILNFWNTLNDVLIERKTPFPVRKANTDRWYDIAIGKSDIYLSINLINTQNKIRLDVYMPNNKSRYDSLYERKDEIESQLGFKMEWDRLEGKKAARICYFMDGLNFDNHSNYYKLINDVIDRIIIMRDVFKKFI